MIETKITTRPEDCIPTSPRVYEDLPALALAEHAMFAYNPSADYDRAVRLAGFDGGKVLSVGPSQAAIAWSPQAIVLSPRGSDETLDWIGNLASGLAWLRRQWRPFLPAGAALGFGFLRQAARIAPELYAATLALKEEYPGARVVLGAHSLGAAIAYPIVGFLDYHGIRVYGAYPFESPRPGNEAFSDWYDQRFTFEKTPTFRVIHVRRGQPDLVTRVPFRRDGYRHAGLPVIIDGDRTILGAREWESYRRENPVERIAGWRFLTRTAAAVRAHFGQELLKALRSRIAIEHRKD